MLVSVCYSETRIRMAAARSMAQVPRKMCPETRRGNESRGLARSAGKEQGGRGRSTVELVEVGVWHLLELDWHPRNKVDSETVILQWTRRVTQCTGPQPLFGSSRTSVVSKTPARWCRLPGPLSSSLHVPAPMSSSIKSGEPKTLDEVQEAIVILLVFYFKIYQTGQWSVVPVKRPPDSWTMPFGPHSSDACPRHAPSLQAVDLVDPARVWLSFSTGLHPRNDAMTKLLENPPRT